MDAQNNMFAFRMINESKKSISQMKDIVAKFEANNIRPKLGNNATSIEHLPNKKLTPRNWQRNTMTANPSFRQRGFPNKNPENLRLLEHSTLLWKKKSEVAAAKIQRWKVERDLQQSHKREARILKDVFY